MTGESEANTRMIYGDLYVLGYATCPVTVQMFSCEFLFLQKIQALLGLDSAAQDKTNHTGRSSGPSLCLDASVFSDFTLLLFIPRLQEKHFQHAVFKTSQAPLFFCHPCMKFFYYMGLFLSYSSWSQLTQSYFGILKKLYHRFCLVCVWIVS